MSIVVNPSAPLIVAQGVTADIVLQPGTVISAKVLQILGNDQVRIAIGGQPLNVVSQVPLQAGQTLQLSVSQTPEGIGLAVVSQQGGGATSQAAADLANAAAPADFVTLAPGAQATSVVVVPNNQLTPPQALAVAIAAETAATQQAGLAPLFANLGVAAGLNGLPPQLQQAVAQLLAQRTNLDQNLTGDDIKQAFQNSGLFLEASLASGSLSSSAGPPDLKAALIVLRQVLTASLNDAPATQSAPVGTPPPGATPASDVPEQALPATAQPATIAIEETPTSTSPALAPLLAPEIIASEVSLPAAAPAIPQNVADFSALGEILSPALIPADAAARAAASSAALNLLQEALQAGPLASANLSGLGSSLASNLGLDNGLMLSLLPAVAGARILRGDDAEFARTNVPPPPIGGVLPAVQPVMPATLRSNSSPETVMHHLLADTDGAIARQTLLQMASLPDRPDTAAGRLDPTAPRWNFEIPFGTGQGTAVVQFEISRDGDGSQAEAAKRIWRARFSLDVEPAGPVHALISLSGERTSVRMWAQRAATADQLRAGAAQLSQALSNAELKPGDIVIQDGTPPQSAPARAGHFLDRAL
jgi:hypothetical protein